MLWIPMLAITGSIAGPLEVKLADKTGLFHVPASMEVAFEIKGPAADAAAETWDNGASSSLAVACSDAPGPAEDDFTEQLLLKVGEDKWGLAPGSTVKFACPSGKPATFVDIHGSTVARFDGGASVTIAKAKPRAER